MMKNEFRKLREAKQQKIYRNYTIYIDRLISMACPKVIEIQPKLKELNLWEYQEPIDLKTLRDKAAVGEYSSSKDLFSDIKSVFINTRNLYRDENETIENIDSLFEEMKLLQQESQMIRDK